jgi:transcriptional regulator with GAF, ATPase, and Fis domain
VRLIAATNRDLQEAMDRGQFRRDLYYRLAVFPIRVPTLRQRRDDIPMLTWHFIEKKRASLGRSIQRVPEETMRKLRQYDWPGNVRELENVIERAMILSPGPVLIVDDLPLTPAAVPAQTVASGIPVPRLEDVERKHITRVLADCNWRVKGPSGAAKQLDLKPSTLRYRMKKLGIVRP